MLQVPPDHREVQLRVSKCRAEDASPQAAWPTFLPALGQAKVAAPLSRASDQSCHLPGTTTAGSASPPAPATCLRELQARGCTAAAPGGAAQWSWCTGSAMHGRMRSRARRRRRRFAAAAALPPPLTRCHRPRPADGEDFAMGKGDVTAEELSLKSPNDKKLYRLCRLPNGLQALLVHDPEINAVASQQAANGAPPHAVEPSDEDVDSLMSGDEEESGSEVRRVAGGSGRGSAATWPDTNAWACCRPRTHLAHHPARPSARAGRGQRERQRGRVRAAAPRPARARRRRRRREEGGGGAVCGGGPLHRPLAPAGARGGTHAEDRAQRGALATAVPPPAQPPVVPICRTCTKTPPCLPPRPPQGLSHYLEHMLFMGSQAYPDENDYDAFLTAHGGASNACTEEVRAPVVPGGGWGVERGQGRVAVACGRGRARRSHCR